VKNSMTGRSIVTRCAGRRAQLITLTAAAAILAALMPAPVPGYAQWKSILKQLGGAKQSGLTEGKIASGLKEALEVGTENTVKSTGRKDGYFANPAIKILLPQKLKTMEQALRLMGKGPQLDDFVLSMNRAAEQAAPLAKPIFLDAVKQMTFDDARKILKGGDTAATDYFKEKTSAQLAEAFTPVVEKEMDEVGVVRRYNNLTGGMTALPFGKSAPFDINRYVVSKSLDGLFYVLGQEEKKIRTIPAAQITPLLKQVFGK
jgi:hypothetical protein